MTNEITALEGKPDKLSYQVQHLEMNHHSLISMTGEILATLRVNLSAGNLLLSNNDDKLQWENMMSTWEKRLKGYQP